MCGGVRYGEVESAVMFVFVHPPFHLSPWNPTSSSFCCPASVCVCTCVCMCICHPSPVTPL